VAKCKMLFINFQEFDIIKQLTHLSEISIYACSKQIRIIMTIISFSRSKLSVL